MRYNPKKSVKICGICEKLHTIAKQVNVNVNVDYSFAMVVPGGGIGLGSP